MHIFSDTSNTCDYHTKSHTILYHPCTYLSGSEKCVRYQLSRVMEKKRPEYSRKGEHSLLHRVLFLPTYNQCIKLQIGMQPVELSKVPTSRVKIYFHATFISYYILLSQYLMHPFGHVCIYVVLFSLSSYSFSFHQYCLFDCPKW